MSSTQNFVDLIVDQLGDLKSVTAKKMFGEYALYSQGKIVALICDDQLFIKPTESGRSFIGDVTEAPPYRGAKNYFLVSDKFEDREWLVKLVDLTEKELPTPKEKHKKKKPQN